MSHHGKFVWCELMTADPAVAATFYGKVVGWSAKDWGAPDRNYLILSAGESVVGGIMDLPPGAQPGWIAYIAVDDVDAAAAKLEKAGGKIHKPADDIPTIGRFCVVADPQGAPFILFKPMRSENPPPAADPTAPGQISWHELHATDWQPAFDFYAGLFGWTKGEAIDMGPMGTYQIFNVDGAMAGGMMTKTVLGVPFWLSYFNVEAVDAAVVRLKEAGGELMHGPQEVPGGSWIAQARDPQGAFFAVVGPKR
ncbi:MAG TPA: VOC family protein [Lichenihabitans sp.]|jgi:hypothetical protein|nr:VOC family protein [Lichenihabitans sp.]